MTSADKLGRMIKVLRIIESMDYFALKTAILRDRQIKSEHHTWLPWQPSLGTFNLDIPITTNKGWVKAPSRVHQLSLWSLDRRVEPLSWRDAFLHAFQLNEEAGGSRVGWGMIGGGLDSQDGGSGKTWRNRQVDWRSLKICQNMTTLFWS